MVVGRYLPKKGKKTNAYLWEGGAKWVQRRQWLLQLLPSKKGKDERSAALAGTRA
jgi:hypothetical protein